jgi:hypothetical protein
MSGISACAYMYGCNQMFKRKKDEATVKRGEKH